MKCPDCETEVEQLLNPGNAHAQADCIRELKRQRDAARLTEQQVQVIHQIIEEHSTDVVDYLHATDDINAALFGGVGKWASAARS